MTQATDTARPSNHPKSTKSYAIEEWQRLINDGFGSI